MKRILILSIAAITAIATSCQKDDLSINPNAAAPTSTVPVSLILNRLTNDVYYGGGVLDKSPGAQTEEPWNQVSRWDQYLVSNTAYYWGSNAYTWSNTATQYSMLKFVNLMQLQIDKQFGTRPTPYLALSKFLKAYSFIWLTQRVGDIPMTQAGVATIATPAYDSQHDVYKNSLALLDTANTLIAPFATANPNAVVDPTGDIYGLTYLQWQKLINTYKLRVLISLSKRAQDTSDLNIPQQFAAIVSDPVKYPVMTSTADNMAYKYNAAYNQYPAYASKNYNLYANVGKPYVDLATANADPRIFVTATPAPAQIKAGKTVNDFTAYVGADTKLGQATIVSNSGAGMYSFNNYNRYFNYSDPGSGSPAEPYVLVGYTEMCFNIAEAANLGWTTESASAWYTKGINSSLATYGITDGKQITVGDQTGKTVGTATVNLTDFNTKITYAGNNDAGRVQILQQKYIAMFQNSGYEPYYNWRRTGVPTLSEGDAGIGTASKKIPMRWLYPNDEIVANAANYQTALQNQGFAKDDVNAVMWLLK